AAIANVVDGTGVTDTVSAALGNYQGIGYVVQQQANTTTGVNNATISQYFAAKPTILAMSQPMGSTIFINSTFTQAQGYRADFAFYTMFHEVLHLLACDNDTQLADAIGASVNPGVNTT